MIAAGMARGEVGGDRQPVRRTSEGEQFDPAPPAALGRPA